MKRKLLMCILCTVLGCLSSCVNTVGESDLLSKKGTIPISFAGKVTRVTQTRVSDKALELGDEIGLMAMISGVPLNGQRYIDNLLLKTSAENALIPEETVYYPEGEAVKLDFLAYYPFSRMGIAKGNSQMMVQVQKDQSLEKNRDLSDFLVASKSKVAASNESVLLSFKHKLAKVRVELVLKDAQLIDELLASNPILKAGGFCTQATYDFISDKFTDPSHPEVITFSGSWRKSAGKLVGKEMIVVPQSITAENQFLVLEVNGRVYTCKLSSNTLSSNSQRVVSISFDEAVDNTLSGFVGEVHSWDEGTVSEEQTESVYQMSQVQTELLAFAKSKVYHIFSNGKLVAELCKEYLRLPDHHIDSQALVVYPVKGSEVDLTQGTVLELLGVKENVHGGTLQWDIQAHTATYIPGKLPPIRIFYINDSDKVVFEKPATSLSVHVKTYELRDVRGSEVRYYGLVKIGTQYWMQENLKTDMYSNGQKIAKQVSTANGPCVLVDQETMNHYYEGRVFEVGKMAPQGWKIPQVADWNVLVDYVGSVAALKAGEWKIIEGVEGDLAPITNLSMFNALPVGVWMEHLTNVHRMVGFWAMDVDGIHVAPQTLIMVGNFADYKLLNTLCPNKDYYKGLSLRLLRN